MSGNKNTLEAVLAEILRREKNSLEIISRLEEVFQSTDDKIIFEYTLEDGSIQTMEIESHGFMMQEFRRIDSNLKSIAGLDELSSANIKLPDGSIKTIITSEIPIEPKAIINVGKPLFFHKKTNKIIDKLLDPLPVVKFDLTDKIGNDTKQVMVKKVVLKLDSTQDLDLFNTEIDGITIEFDDLITKLIDNGITWSEFDDIVTFPPKSPKYRGTFDVLNIFKKNVPILTFGGGKTSKKVLTYKLNTILYKDLEQDESDIALKRGDDVLVNDENFRDTKYRVDTVDPSNNEVTFRKIQGYRNITKGIEKLIVNPGFLNKFELEVGVNVNEYMVTFFKSLNPNLDIVNLKWGEGIGLFTGDLVDFDDKVNNIKLSNFYDDFMGDPGKNLQALTNEGFIPLQDAIKPDAPILNADDFKVIQINKHREDVQSTEALRKKFSEKNTTRKDIEKIDTSIEKQKNLIAIGDFKNDRERGNAEKSLNDLFIERSTKVTRYNTLIDDIIARTKEIGDFKPKYRIRAFFEIPQPKYLDDNKKLGKQEVIQFEPQYRYLRKDNTSTEADAFVFSQTDGADTEAKKGTFSRWIKLEGKRKIKEIEEENKIVPTTDDENNVVVVKTTVNETEDTNNPDEINFNQIDIPISPNENVEIRVRSISEAGYPHMLSDFSDSVTIEFPEELIDDVASIGEEAQEEQLRATFLQELNAIGLDQHLSNSFEMGGDTFDHLASRIATTFRTPENKPIDVNQVLIEQKAEIDALRALISAEIAEMSISIVDDLGEEIQNVSNNDTVNIFAGYYNDIVTDANIPKGEVVTKLYYIEISNVSDVVLELLSYAPGIDTEILPIGDTTPPDPDFVSPYEGFLVNKNEYSNFRKYWRVPMSLRAITADKNFNEHHDEHQTDSPFIQLPAYQSGQVKGQFIYSRKKDITLNNNLFTIIGDETLPAVHTDQVFVPTQSGGSPEAFVWDETLTVGSPNGNGNATDFCVHVDHPDLESNSDLMIGGLTGFQALFNGSTKLPSKTIEGTGSVNYPFFMHSRFFDLVSTEQDGLKQLNYLYYEPELSGGATTENFPKKISFTKNDKYLIGKNTCGNYLFIAPAAHETVYTGSQVFNAGKLVKKGDKNILRIPFIYQFRMTDYHGAGSSGNGVLGGFGSPPDLSSLAYAKKIGVDIQVKDQTLFSFDIQVSAQYKARSVGDTGG